MLLMEEILHQLIGSISVYPIVYGALCIVGGAGFLPSTVSPAKLDHTLARKNDSPTWCGVIVVVWCYCGGVVLLWWCGVTVVVWCYCGSVFVVV